MVRQSAAVYGACAVTPAQLKRARLRLGISQSELGRRLRLGSDPGRLIRRWEAGDVPVSGPASVAVEYMIAEHETLADENQ